MDNDKIELPRLWTAENVRRFGEAQIDILIASKMESALLLQWVGVLDLGLTPERSLFALLGPFEAPEFSDAAKGPITTAASPNPRLIGQPVPGFLQEGPRREQTVAMYCNKLGHDQQYCPARPEPIPCEFPRSPIPAYHVGPRLTDSIVIQTGTGKRAFDGPTVASSDEELKESPTLTAQAPFNTESTGQTDKSQEDVVEMEKGTTGWPNFRPVCLKKKAIRAVRAIAHAKNGHCGFVRTHETSRYRTVVSSSVGHVENPGTSPGPRPLAHLRSPLRRGDESDGGGVFS